jgi:hypothetical protein
MLLGYDASNIYRVWLPASNRVIRVRDVRFIDDLYKDKSSTLPARPQVIEITHIPEEEYDADTIVVAQPMRQRQATVTSSPVQKQIQQQPSSSLLPCLSHPTQSFQQLLPFCKHCGPGLFCILADSTVARKLPTAKQFSLHLLQVVASGDLVPECDFCAGIYVFRCAHNYYVTNKRAARVACATVVDVRSSCPDAT